MAHSAGISHWVAGVPAKISHQTIRTSSSNHDRKVRRGGETAPTEEDRQGVGAWELDFKQDEHLTDEHKGKEENGATGSFKGDWEASQADTQ